jgi:hypothetical protein
VVGSAGAARTERRGALRGAGAVVAWRLDQERGERAQDGGRPALVRGSGADEARAGAGDAARAFTAAGARSVRGRREGARERARARGRVKAHWRAGSGRGSARSRHARAQQAGGVRV